MAKKSNIVKKAKGNINLLIIVLLIVSWVCALITVTSNEEEEQQLALVKQAEVYLEDDLYIRAVSSYKKALNYNTEQNYKIETDLLATYLEADMLDDYYGLAAERVADETAAMEEYMALAQMYVDKKSYAKALPILQSGIKRFQDEAMIELRESVIYESKRRDISVVTLEQMNADKIMPAFNGEKWGYVNDGGGVVLDYIYDEATPFSGNYAVVKLEGIYTVINKNGYRYSVDKIGLDKVEAINSSSIVGIKDGRVRVYNGNTFKPKSEEVFDNIILNDNGLFVVQRDGKWAILSPSFEKVTDYIFTDVALNSHGQIFSGNYAVVNDGTGYFLINAKGEPMHADRFVDAKGYEGGLYAVANSQGKWGLADKDGKVIVDYQYGDAISMSSNLAAVEYGGKWGYINQYNTMIIEPRYVSAYPFVGNVALTQNEMGHYEVIILKFYEFIQ